MTARDGISCPLCAGDTRVSNTKQEIGRIRRLRQCLTTGCSGRLWTVETAIDRPPPDVVLVPRRTLAHLHRLVAKLCSPTVKQEISCGSPDDSDTPVIDGQ